ncbi:pancreatic triacylglycerol lipase isoform X2 [Neodiprion pinetum]|uniref:phospholipase A1 n=1 Tax=Neodiprion lecontei TaxID=441921 RepID=A0ABM3FT58_NEOLC|nr:pancreatic triacylglycerol lipase-like isoform X2 [Neodiprion fabricii]XP_046473851.1 pancreatic triacylglycerol lipase-like isoform X2 [Neodiprion pinetum]XP_046591199.1 pancreatic triacylglycerol lipase-like isoform X2 [Neodiprion lecontei]
MIRILDRIPNKWDTPKGYFASLPNSAIKELRKKYDGYGDDWIFMPDGNGQPQVAVLKGYVPETRGFFDEDRITYFLHTREGPKNGTKIKINDKEALNKSGFSPSRPTKFITHGWKSSAFSAGFRDMKDAWLAQGEYNVFLVDWEPLAASTFYLGPMANTGRVGKDAATFIDFLVHATGMKTEDVHFIGHSLGAHVAGNTGHQTTSGLLGRITGLDPALPGIHIFSTLETRLDPSDAKFVDIIHSCGGVLGYFQPLGHADFYPNGGTAVQPGCCCIPELLEACSHGRSYEYFIESIIIKNGFPATRCSDWDHYMGKKCSDSDVAYMGAHTDPSTNGSYFLQTRHEKPYGYAAEVTQNEV